MQRNEEVGPLSCLRHKRNPAINGTQLKVGQRPKLYVLKALSSDGHAILGGSRNFRRRAPAERSRSWGHNLMSYILSYLPQS